MSSVVIGVGNEFRRDDGVGPVIADGIRTLDLPGTRVVTTDGEPGRMLDAWANVDVAVVIDAVLCRDSVPGRVHRMDIDGIPGGTAANSSHGLGVPEAVELARALDRMPGRIVFYTVEVGDTGFGTGLSARVAAAVPTVTAAVLRELDRRQ